MNVLGLSCWYHDAAACLLVDGVISGAASEEAFTRKKHDSRFPVSAIRWLLSNAGLSVGDVSAVVYYDKPMRKFDRAVRTQLSVFPEGFPAFMRRMPQLVTSELQLASVLRTELGYRGPVLYSEHVSMKSTSEIGGLDKTSYTTGLETSRPFLVIFFPRKSETENLAKVLTKSVFGKFTAQQHGLKVDVAGDQSIDSAFVIISDGSVPASSLRSIFPYLRDRALVYAVGSIKKSPDPGLQILPVLVGSPVQDFDPNVAQDRIKTLASFAEALSHHKFGRIVEPPLPVSSE